MPCTRQVLAGLLFVCITPRRSCQIRVLPDQSPPRSESCRIRVLPDQFIMPFTLCLLHYGGPRAQAGLHSLGRPIHHAFLATLPRLPRNASPFVPCFKRSVLASQTDSSCFILQGPGNKLLRRGIVMLGRTPKKCDAGADPQPDTQTTPHL